MKKIILLIAIFCLPIQLLQQAQAQQLLFRRPPVEERNIAQQSQPVSQYKKSQQRSSLYQTQYLLQRPLFYPKPQRPRLVYQPQSSLQFFMNFAKINAAESASNSAPASPVSNKKSTHWSGFYVGGHVGRALVKSKMLADAACTDYEASWACTNDRPESRANIPVLNASGSGILRDESLTVGLHLGYDMKIGNIVFGPKIDISRLKIKSSQSASAYMPAGGFDDKPINIGSSVNANWIITTQGRVGLASDNMLFYATGGLAAIDVKVSNFYSDYVGGSERASKQKWQQGFVVGGGFELALDKHWSLAIEYSYMDFGKITAKGLVVSSNPGEESTASPLDVSSNLTVKLATAGLNYRF